MSSVKKVVIVIKSWGSLKILKLEAVQTQTYVYSYMSKNEIKVPLDCAFNVAFVLVKSWVRVNLSKVTRSPWLFL
jgi:hypothetical protein